MRTILHTSALFVLAVAAVAALAATALSALGVLPWLSLSVGFGGHVRLDAGMKRQIGVTSLLWVLVAFFPSATRMRALERSHRDLRMTIRDVARAYHAAHAADYKGVFTLSSEFEQMRERLEHLRTCPSLKLLEADMLTMAARVSQQSQRLVPIHSEDGVVHVGRAGAVTDESGEAEDPHRHSPADPVRDHALDVAGGAEGHGSAPSAAA